MATRTAAPTACPMPIYTTLSERLVATRDAAEAAWAQKAATGWRETIGALAATVRAFDVRAPEITDNEGWLRMRSELAEALRAAASAIAPRVS